MKKTLFGALGLVFLVLLLDQWVKIYVKTHLRLGEEVHIAGNWFFIHFTENPGMVFGIEFGDGSGKIALSLFRLLAVSAIGWFGLKMIREKRSRLLITCIALVFAGAVGNLLDNCFYGLLFGESDLFRPAEFMPAGGGYGGFLHGQVVDMFYFPILHGHYPNWIPIWGGEEFEFFHNIFNVADASITAGVWLLIIYLLRMFRRNKKSADPPPGETSA